jgi:predicted SAM-dependent methyltransferase
MPAGRAGRSRPCHDGELVHNLETFPLIENTNMAQRIGARIQQFPLVYKAATLAIQALGLMRRHKQIATYLSDNETRCLRVGSGSHTDPGWLSVDLVPVSRGVVFIDATKRFPLPSASFDAVQCEHVIEHVAHEAGLTMLRECHRILRKGGILRIATPNLDLVRRLLDDSISDRAVAAYVNWSNRAFGAPSELSELSNAVFTVNRFVRNWGHVFLYDEPTLRRALAAAGFSEIVRVTPGQSSHPVLVGMDRHEQEIGKEANELETLALEATA